MLSNTTMRPFADTRGRLFAAGAGVMPSYSVVTRWTAPVAGTVSTMSPSLGPPNWPLRVGNRLVERLT